MRQKDILLHHAGRLHCTMQNIYIQGVVRGLGSQSYNLYFLPIRKCDLLFYLKLFENPARLCNL